MTREEVKIADEEIESLHQQVEQLKEEIEADDRNKQLAIDIIEQLSHQRDIANEKLDAAELLIMKAYYSGWEDRDCDVPHMKGWREFETDFMSQHVPTEHKGEEDKRGATWLAK